MSEELFEMNVNVTYELHVIIHLVQKYRDVKRTMESNDVKFAEWPYVKEILDNPLSDPILIEEDKIPKVIVSEPQILQLNVALSFIVKIEASSLSSQASSPSSILDSLVSSPLTRSSSSYSSLLTTRSASSSKSAGIKSSFSIKPLSVAATPNPASTSGIYKL